MLLYKLSYGFGDSSADDREMAIVWAPDEPTARALANIELMSDAFNDGRPIEVTIIPFDISRSFVVYSDFEHV